MFCTSTSALPTVCVQCPVWLFSVVPSFRAFPLCCLGTVWVILRWFHWPLLLSVSVLLSHSTCSEFILWGLYVSEYSQLYYYYYYYYYYWRYAHRIYAINSGKHCLPVCVHFSFPQLLVRFRLKLVFVEEDSHTKITDGFNFRPFWCVRNTGHAV